MSQVHRQVRKLIIQLLDQLAPQGMQKGQLKKLSEAAGLGKTTILNAKRRHRISADTLLALLLVRGVDPDDILNLPRKKPSRISVIDQKWSQFMLELTDREKIVFMDLMISIKNKLKVK